MSRPAVREALQRMAATRLVEVIFFACICWQSLELWSLRRGEPSAGAGGASSACVRRRVAAAGRDAAYRSNLMPWASGSESE